VEGVSALKETIGEAAAAADAEAGSGGCAVRVRVAIGEAKTEQELTLVPGLIKAVRIACYLSLCAAVVSWRQFS
jgi:hypothetical protein